MRKKTNFFKNTELSYIFIQLGNGCNLRCKYCYHNDDDQSIVDDNYINDDIFDFIEQVAEHEKNGIEVRFFGGEPLLYFDKIKYVTEHIAHLVKQKKIKLSTITNGKLIDKEMVDFFNKYHFRVTVSWDGHDASKKYRGYDALGENKDNIFAIKEVGVLSTIVDLTDVHTLLKDVEKNVNEYYTRSHRVFNWSWTVVEDMGTQTDYIDKSDYETICKEFRYFTNRIKEAILKPDDKKTPMDVTLEALLYGDLHGAMKTTYNSDAITRGSDNPGTFSINLRGELFSMHRFPDASQYAHKLGTIYDNYFTYLKNVLSAKGFNNQIKRNGCIHCKCYGLCRGPGPNLKLESEALMCKNRRAVRIPFIEMLEDLCGIPWKDALSEWMHSNDSAMYPVSSEYK